MYDVYIQLETAVSLQSAKRVALPLSINKVVLLGILYRHHQIITSCAQGLVSLPLCKSQQTVHMHLEF